MNSVKQQKIKIYDNEGALFFTAFFIASIFWLILLVSTVGGILVILPFVFIVYLFVQSGFVSYMKGTGALLSARQFPDIQQQVESCAQKVGLDKPPAVYIIHMNGMFNAFALRFLRKNYIILLSDIVDALKDKPDALNFYIGHEMGHIHRKHTLWEAFLAPALILPLLGAAYSRSREYTCDQYGAACCEQADSAQMGLAALAVGGNRYASINKEAYLDQLKDTKGFWMSFHELVGNYPWLTKRFARVGDKDSLALIPKRNPLAYVLAIFVPRLSVMTFVMIYLVLIIAGAATGGIFKGHELIKNAEDKAALQSMDNSMTSDATSEVSYEVGKAYDNGYGEYYLYKGGDPELDSSWQAVPENDKRIIREADSVEAK